MRLLLDTHVFLWLLAEPERLGEHARHLRLTLVTADEDVARYDVRTVLV